MHFGGPVEADDHALLDVGTPARTRNDRERGRKRTLETREERREVGENPILRQKGDVDVADEVTRARLIRRSCDDDAARVCEPVEGDGDPGLLDRRRLAAVDAEARLFRVSNKALHELLRGHRRSRNRRCASGARVRPALHARPGPTRGASRCPIRAKVVESR